MAKKLDKGGAQPEQKSLVTFLQAVALEQRNSNQIRNSSSATSITTKKATSFPNSKYP
jgi:hypothetical protein